MRRPKKPRGVVAVLVLGFLLVFAGSEAAASSTTSSSTTSSSTTSSTKTSTSTTSSSTTPPIKTWVGVAQTVVASTSSTGKISGKPQVFTQFSANGSGPHTLKVPMSTSGFRNLSGLGTPPVQNGYAVWNLHLSGPTSQRTVAHFPTDRLPVTVSAAYELNGKKMKAKDIVGKTGLLKVSYVITNVTTKDTKVTFKNVFGAEETTTVKAPVPVAAVVDVTIPASFTNVSAPAASASGNGNGTSTASWTLFLFDPLGGVKQSVSYQAHVTDVAVPSATVEAAVAPPKTIKPLPSIKEPGAPAVPTVTLGSRLASLQTKLQAKLGELAAKASNALSSFQKVAVPAVQKVSGKAAQLAADLPALSADARNVSTTAGQAATSLSQSATAATDHASRMAGIEGGLAQAAVDAADHARRAADVSSGLALAAGDAADAARRVADVRTGLEALPPPVHLTPAYRALHAKVVELEVRLIAHAAGLTVAAARAKDLQIRLIAHSARLAVWAVRAKVLEGLLNGAAGVLTRTSSATTNVLAPAALTASTKLTGLVPTVSDLSTKAAQAANTLANVTLHPKSKKSAKAIQPKQVGGGAHLDAAVGKLDSAITDAGNKVDSAYAYLKALDKRSAENLLPTGDAIGATFQTGAYVYSVSGANNTAHQVHLAGFIGGFALTLGLLFGIGLYRVRRGLPSSLAPPKAAPAKG
jgi:hypothetical protein